MSTKTFLDSLGTPQSSLVKSAKAEIVPVKPKESYVGLTMVDQYQEDQEEKGESLTKSILNVLNGGKGNSIERLAFEEDPAQRNQYAGLYKAKMKLIPDSILKRISIQDDLVAAIVNARSNHLSSFGRPRPDRFSLGFTIDPKPGVLDKMSEEQKNALQERIAALQEKISTCGSTEGVTKNDMMTFSQYLFMSTRDAMTVGRIATEVIYVNDLKGNRVAHSFRPIDGGTIYRATNQKGAAETTRASALKLLESIKNKKLVPERIKNDEYAWIQVVEGRPIQAFTSDECLVHNFYPVTHVELNGYPLSPIDTVITAITTHINITTHNKMYFQTGRAAKGMLVVKSDDMKESVLSRIKQQFNASINSVGNSHRVPVFGVSSEDEIMWQSMDASQKDAEFQYLADSNARTIISAYQMSPDELPGWGHLSKGTNSQSLCLDPDSNVFSQEDGITSIRDLLSDQEEVLFDVWTGTEFAPAKAFWTGDKDQVRTCLANGYEIVTSPEHRFRVGVDEELIWKHQKDLKVGDLVLVQEGAGTDLMTSEVSEIEPLEGQIKMVDITVYNDEHAFVANRIVVHNSESNSEFKLTAARDVGLNPLVKQWEDFINGSILPLFDPTLAKLVTLELKGLNAETAEKESIRLQQDMPVHMTMDEVLEKIEKDPLGKEWAGEFPMNPGYQQILDNHAGLTVGEIASHFLGRPELKERPDLQYVRDPMWFQWQGILMQKEQMQQQMQAQQAQAQQAQQGGGDPNQPPPEGGPGGGGEQAPQGEEGAEQQEQPQAVESDLARSIDQAIGLLSKSEKQLPASKKKVLALHQRTVDHFMDGWAKDLEEAQGEILAAIKKEKK